MKPQEEQPVAPVEPIVQKEPTPQPIEQPKPVEPIVQKEPSPVFVEQPKPIVEAPVSFPHATPPVINEEKPAFLVISRQTFVILSVNYQIHHHLFAINFLQSRPKT